MSSLTRSVESHTQTLAAKYGLDLRDHRTVQLTLDMVLDAQHVVTLDTSSFWEIHDITGEKSPKVSMLTAYGNIIPSQDIPNPLYGEIEFEKLYEVLVDLVDRFVAKEFVAKEHCR